MTDSNLTHICMILDCSGSMQSVKPATISGYNEFIEAQQKAPGRAVVDLVLFNHDVLAKYAGQPVQKVRMLTAKDYTCDGNTALYDAMGSTIDALGISLAGTVEARRPGRVVVVLMTDGMENASKNYLAGRVSTLVKHQRETYAWEFVFLGANQDAVLTGATMGVPTSSSVTYCASTIGTRSTFQVTSAKVAALRAGDDDALSYSTEDRAKTMGQVP